MPDEAAYEDAKQSILLRLKAVMGSRGLSREVALERLLAYYNSVTSNMQSDRIRYAHYSLRVAIIQSLRNKEPVV